MVYLTGMLKKSFGYQLDNLKSTVRDNYSFESPESSFAEYIFLCSGNESISRKENYIFNTLNRQRFYQAPMLAAIGYKIAFNVEEFDQDLLALWKEGFSRLATKETFTLDRTSFFYRPIELLGISLGAANCSKIDPENLDWLRTIVRKGKDKLDNNDYWSYLIGNLAASSLNVTWTDKSQLIPEDMTIEELALVKFLFSFHISIPKIQEVKSIEDKINKVLLERCLIESEISQDIARASIVYCSLKETVNQILGLSFNQYQEITSGSNAAIKYINSISNGFNLAIQKLESQSEISLSKKELNNTANQLSTIESIAKKALSLVNNIIKQKNPDAVVINNQYTNNHINMNEYNLQHSKFGGGFATENSTQYGGILNDYSYNSVQNIDDINYLVSSLRESIQNFPDEQREDAQMELEELEEAIKNPEKQNPRRLGIRLKRLAATGAAVLSLTKGAVNFSEDINKFTENIMKLGQKLEIPIELIRSNK